MSNPLSDHLASVDETYVEHMGHAFSFGGAMILAGVACLIHGLMPNLFVRTGSRTISALHGRMVTHRRKSATTGAFSDYVI